MRPDSQLYIVPFAGGRARLMNCNTSLMNSWHSFSPNGRWLAFSSKARSPYTQLMLTHIDADGNDTPPILVDNTTAANRAVNIPEFVNLPPEGLEKIALQATEFYRVAAMAFESMEKGQMAEAAQQWRDALQLDPDDAQAHFGLAVSLTGNNQEREAVEEYRKACALDGHQAAWFAHLAASLAQTGDPDGAVDNFRKSLALDPSSAGTEADLGAALFESGQTQEGIEHMRKAVDMAPEFGDGHSYLGTALAKIARMDEATAEMQKAIALVPTSAEFRFNLGFVLRSGGDYAGAVDAFEKSVELSEGKDPRCLAALADAYDKTGHSDEAVRCARKALDLAIQDHDLQLQEDLRSALERYQRDATQARPQ
jgi:Flp pilus assembly protein TadD